MNTNVKVKALATRSLEQKKKDRSGCVLQTVKNNNTKVGNSGAQTTIRIDRN